jgi:hypothetical protein
MSKNEILCAEAASFGAERSEYFWSSVANKTGKTGTTCSFGLLRLNTTRQTNNAYLAGGPGLF